MAWTTPRTWVTGEVVTASIMNTHVRDNFNETGPARATSATSGFIVTNGTNAVIQRIPDTAFVSTSETTTSGAYTNLTTTGPSVTVTTGTSAIVMFSAQMSNNTAGASCFVSVDITGATTANSTDNIACIYESGAANDLANFGTALVYGGLTAGSSTFKLEYKVSTGTGTFLRRRLSVIPI